MAKEYSIEMNLLKNLTTKELVQVGNEIVKGNVSDIESFARDPNASALQVMIASVVAKVIQKGDMQTFDLLLNRLVGKVKDEIHMSGEITNPPQVVITLPLNNRTPEHMINVTPKKEVESAELDDYSFD